MIACMCTGMTQPVTGKRNNGLQEKDKIWPRKWYSKKKEAPNDIICCWCGKNNLEAMFIKKLEKGHIKAYNLILILEHTWENTIENIGFPQ